MRCTGNGRDRKSGNDSKWCPSSKLAQAGGYGFIFANLSPADNYTYAH
jgi:hypothetical protein